MGSVWMTLCHAQRLCLRSATAAGLWALGAVLTKYVAVIVLPALLIHLIMSHKHAGSTWRKLPIQSWKTVVAFASPFLLTVLPMLLLLAIFFDFRLLYEEELIGGIQRGWFGVPLTLGMTGLLASWGKSIFLYNPILLISILGSLWFAKRHGWQSLLFIAIPLAYLLLYSKKEVWYGGNSWGPRYLMPTIPLLVCMAAPVFEWIGMQRHRWVSLATATLLVVSVIPQILGVSKDFDQYLGLYADQIVWQLPDNGAVYGGKQYQQWSSIQPEGDLAAVLFAPQFSPILGHIWLLRADFTKLILPDRLDLVEDALGRAPWLRFGITAFPERPQDGTGLDFWSMTMWANYINHKGVVAVVIATLIAIELCALLSLGLLLRWPTVTKNTSRRVRIATLTVSATGFVVFDTLHFML